jgi:hypothetical protein
MELTLFDLRATSKPVKIDGRAAGVFRPEFRFNIGYAYIVVLPRPQKRVTIKIAFAL